MLSLSYLPVTTGNPSTLMRKRRSAEEVPNKNGTGHGKLADWRHLLNSPIPQHREIISFGHDTMALHRPRGHAHRSQPRARWAQGLKNGRRRASAFSDTAPQELEVPLHGL